LFYLSHVPVSGDYWHHIAPGLILMGLGMGATFVSVTIAATSGVPHHESGLASGLLNTSQQVGGALGLAILTGIASSSTARYIEGLNLQGAPSHYQVAAATVHGFHEGYLIGAGFGVAASIIAAIVIKEQKARSDPSHGEVALPV
jgi:MFS family permease